MPVSACYLVKNAVEFRESNDVNSLPNHLRGIYVLFQEAEGGRMNVVYVGMARGENSGIKGRLRSHRSNKAKQGKWSHFSVFEVWDNIPKNVVEELEGMFRQIYRKDATSNSLAVQKTYKPLQAVIKQTPYAAKARRSRAKPLVDG